MNHAVQFRIEIHKINVEISHLFMPYDLDIFITSISVCGYQYCLNCFTNIPNDIFDNTSTTEPYHFP